MESLYVIPILAGGEAKNLERGWVNECNNSAYPRTCWETVGPDDSTSGLPQLGIAQGIVSSCISLARTQKSLPQIVKELPSDCLAHRAAKKRYTFRRWLSMPVPDFGHWFGNVWFTSIPCKRSLRIILNRNRLRFSESMSWRIPSTGPSLRAMP